MCLNIDLFSRKLTAKDDISVYKLVYIPKYILKNPETLSPITAIMGYPFNFNTLLKSELRRTWNFRNYWKCEVHHGLHSYVYLNDAIDAINNIIKIRNDKKYNFCIVKAIIPKSSKYYIGNYMFGDSIASNKLIITDKILYDNC